MRLVPVASLVFVFACQKSESGLDQAPPTNGGSGSGSAQGAAAKKAPPKPHVEPVQPPVDLKNPPADAVKLPSGLIYKKLVTNDSGAAPKRNDTVLINFTGWKQTTGETTYSSRGKGQPSPLHLSTAAKGFAEGMPLVKKGEKVVFWMPPAIAYRTPPVAPETPDTLIYEVELVGIEDAPPVPADVAKPPDKADQLKSGIKYVVIKPGTGKDKAGLADTVTFNYTAWDSEGRMFDTTEIRNKPGMVQPYKQSVGMEALLTSLVAGERARFWADADKMTQSGHPLPGNPKGLLCYEVEVVAITKSQHQVPAVPADVAKPPADAQKTAKGTFYKVLKAGPPGQKPQPTENVRVNYTGWTVDGRMFDSSVIKGEPAEFALNGVVAGWTDAIQLMSIGDTYRLWIPEELAYKGSPGKPQGMLVFDIELLEIKEPKKPANPHGGMPPGGPPGGPHSGGPRPKPPAAPRTPPHQ